MLDSLARSEGKSYRMLGTEQDYERLTKSFDSRSRVLQWDMWIFRYTIFDSVPAAADLSRHAISG